MLTLRKHINSLLCEVGCAAVQIYYETLVIKLSSSENTTHLIFFGKLRNAQLV